MAIQQELLDYIKTGLGKGLSVESLRQSLLEAGWAPGDVQAALEASAVSLAAPRPPAVAPVVVAAAPTEPRERISIYSAFLSFVLVASLFILANTTISDVDRHIDKENVSKLLLVNAGLILPFLLATFGIHTSFYEKSGKFRVLTRPYYLVSGWLLIRLLWESSQHILTTNAAYGLYIVLVMAIAVLTLVVFLYQRLAHRL